MSVRSAFGGIDRRTVTLLAGLAVGLFAAELAETVFATALPTLVADLGGLRAVPWVNTAYLLASTIVLPVYGRLSDQLGRRPMVLTAVSLFLVGSLIGALAPSMPVLLGARVLQGLGGGGLLILLQSVVADRVPIRDRAGVMSGVGAVFAVAAVTGPPLGGWLADGVGWRWAFWLNLSLGLVALAAAAVLLPRGSQHSGPVRLDVAGTLLLAVAVSGLVTLGTGSVGSPMLRLLLAVGTLLAIVAFCWEQLRTAEPLIPLRLFGNRTFSLSVLAGAMLGLTTFGVAGYLPFHLQLVTASSATATGVLMLALVAGLALATLLAAQVVRRTGQYRGLLVVGCVLVAGALLLLATVRPGTPLPLLVGALFLLGVGTGCAWEIVVVVAQSTVPTDEVGTGTATNGLLREIGVCLGSALVGGWFVLQLGQLLGHDATAGLTAEALAALPTEARLAASEAYADAVAPLFLLLTPVALAAAMGFGLLRPVTLAGPDREARPDRSPSTSTRSRVR